MDAERLRTIVLQWGLRFIFATHQVRQHETIDPSMLGNLHVCLDATASNCSRSI